MTVRIYISKLIGDGTSVPNAFRPAWQEILSRPYPAQIGQITESARYGFWLGMLDTDDTQHAALIADNRVRFIPQALLSTTLQNLTAAQRTAALEVYTFLGFDPTIWNQTNAHVADILFYLMGRAAWDPISQAADAIP